MTCFKGSTESLLTTRNTNIARVASPRQTIINTGVDGAIRINYTSFDDYRGFHILLHGCWMHCDHAHCLILALTCLLVAKASRGFATDAPNRSR